MKRWYRCVDVPLGVRIGIVLLAVAAAWMLMGAFGVAGPEDGADKLRHVSTLDGGAAPERALGSSAASTVTVSLSPSIRSVHAGESFTLAVEVASGAQTVNRVQAYVDFDPQYLQVLEISRGSVLVDEVYNAFDNTAGWADYVVEAIISGTAISTLTGTFTLNTITFQAVTATTGTTLTFHTAPPRETQVLSGSTVLSSTLSGSTVVIEPPTEHAIYLPLILRSYTPLRANFTADPTSGRVPLKVAFANESTGRYTDSLWEFGDGITSTQTSPTHTYTLTGTFTVTLTVMDAHGTPLLPSDVSTLARPNYITVYYEGPPNAPSHMQATSISCSQFRLEWQDNSTDEDGFTIYEGANWVADVPANTTTYTAGGFAPGTYHCFRVRAYNEHGDSEWSDWGCGTTPACDDLIVNGGFEQDEGWEIPGTPYPATYTTAITRTGARAMRSGIVEVDDNRFSYSDFRQTVSIPTDAVSATLRFWLYRLSGETPYTPTFPLALLASDVEKMALADDLQYVLVLNQYNQIRRQLIWQRVDDQAWTFHEFDMLVHAGETVKLQFGVYNDGVDGVTAMYVDDVSLDVCVSEGQALEIRIDRRK